MAAKNTENNGTAKKVAAKKKPATDPALKIEIGNVMRVVTRAVNKVKARGFIITSGMKGHEPENNKVDLIGALLLAKDAEASKPREGLSSVEKVAKLYNFTPAIVDALEEGFESDEDFENYSPRGRYAKLLKGVAEKANKLGNKLDPNPEENTENNTENF